jgi:phage repressor protein C with HTH and peptisase S24 domain
MSVSSETAHPVGQRFEEEVKRLGGPTFVAGLIGKSRNTIYNWFASADMTAADLVQLAGHGLDVLYVLTGQRNVIDAQTELMGIAQQTLHRTVDVLDSKEARLVRVSLRGSEHFVDPDEYRWIPFYDVEFGAGGGRVVDFGRPPKKFNAYRRDYLQDRGLLDADLFEATVIGDSQYPEIFDGDIIMVNASDRSITSGEIYVIQMGDEWICKYLRRLPEGKIEVYSKNEELHRPFEISEGQLGNGVEVIGRVVRQGRDR